MRIIKGDLWDAIQTVHVYKRKFQRHRKSHKFSAQTCHTSVREERGSYWNVNNLVYIMHIACCCILYLNKIIYLLFFIPVVANINSCNGPA